MYLGNLSNAFSITGDPQFCRTPWETYGHSFNLSVCNSENHLNLFKNEIAKI